MLKGPGRKPLGFLEEARFLQELRCAHNMSLGEIAVSLGRSKGWVSVRLSSLAEMSETVRDAVFRGRFPAHAYTHVIRPFARANGIATTSSIDAFVRAASGRGLSTREIARLADAYFRGPDELRRQIESGRLTMALDELAGATPGAGCSSRERACLKELVHLAKAMERLPGRAADPRLNSGAFRAQAEILLARVLARAGEFVDAMRRFHGRCKTP
jgi:hypothetical protein